MHFSTRTRYGLRFLLCLAELPPGERIQLSQVGEKENISSGYLQQIARALRPLNILTAVRGADGGYGLNRPPEDINLEDVIVHLEGEISPVRCLTDNCPRKDMCKTVSFWQQFDDHMRSFLRSKTLRDLGSCADQSFMDDARDEESIAPCPQPCDEGCLKPCSQIWEEDQETRKG